MKKMSKGFTLIELLVVVALIGILTAVVLASTSASRARGANVSIKTNLKSLSQQAEIYYLNNGNSYGVAFSGWPETCSNLTAGTMFTDKIIWSAIQEIQSRSGYVPTCVAGPEGYVVIARLKTPENGKTYWCVDSHNKNKGTTDYGMGLMYDCDNIALP